jgi:hypothetical protein
MPCRRMGEWMYRSHFLDLGTSWQWAVSFMSRPLYPRGKSPLYPLDRRLGGPQHRSGRHGEVKILATIGTRTRPFGHPAHSQSLYRLRYPGSWLWDGTKVPNYSCMFLVQKKRSYPSNRSWSPIGLWDVEAPTFSSQSAHRWRWSRQPYALAGRSSPLGRFVALISVRGWVDRRFWMPQITFLYYVIS